MTGEAHMPRIVSIQTTNERGGAEYANVDLLDALVARGRDVVLLTNMPDLAAGTKVPVREVNLGPKLARRTTLRLILESPLILMRLAWYLYRERPVGAVLLHFKKEQLLCSLLPSWLTGRVVWAEWGKVPDQMRHGLARLLYRLAARRATRIMVVSEGVARTVYETGVPSEKVIVEPNLVSMHQVAYDAAGRTALRRAWGVGEGTLVLGCISRFQIRKRNDVAIDAMAHLPENVMLVLAGDGEQEQALRERAAPYGDRVRFVPSVRGWVEAFLSACDLLVFAPSFSEADRPRVIVMAQLVGVPIVATHPEGADALRPPGAGTIISPPNDPRALAAAIVAYQNDPERRSREGKIAQAAMLDSHDLERTLRVMDEALGLQP
jgi:glycosyltransferase involved in cell wall biosynthesis